MIRCFIGLFVSLLLVSACATGKAVKSTKLYTPTAIQISDVNVDVMSDVSNRGTLRKLMRNAATNIALAYNENSSLSAPEYVMEVSIQAYKASPVSAANLRYEVILRNPEDGTSYREVPVVYGNLGAETSSVRPPAKPLIEGSLPEAFVRLYGLLETPSSVKQMLTDEDIFADPASNQTIASQAAPAYVAPAVYTAPEPTTSTEQTGDEPKVITCAVC